MAGEGIIGPQDGREVPRFAGPDTFARLPRLEELGGRAADVVIAGIPFDSGVSYRPGARFGPRAVRGGSKMLRPYHPELKTHPFAVQQVADAGDIAVNPFDIGEAIGSIERAARALLGQAGHLIAIGGDHTIALPLLRATAAKHGPVSLVHFDAHLDTWDTYFGAPYTHGTPFRRAVEEGVLALDTSAHVGIRSPLYAETDLSDDRELGFATVSAADLARTGVDQAIDRIRSRAGDRPVYISVDIDVLDPAHAPGTGTPEPGGLTSRELQMILRGLTDLNLVGADVVEVAPAYDHAELTALAAASVAYELLSLFALKLPWSLISKMSTHEVTNQPPPLTGYDVSDDPALLDALRRAGAGWAEPAVRELGRLAGSERFQEAGRLANENPPRLRTHDRYGHRIDEVEFHPAYHELMDTAISHGLHAAPWRDQREGAHAARAAGFLVWSQAEAGHCCPVSMTYSIIPALRHAPDLARQYEPLLAATAYDPSHRPATEKRGLTAGMSMTEKQGGSDVRANTTAAVRQRDGGYHLTGHKWFTSAPMGDLFMVLAQAEGGLSCFLLPRILPDGTRNTMRLMRLKDKLGNRSNASAEVEYEGATAWLVGEEGRGVRTILEMVNSTRLDCVLAATSMMRLGVVQAAHHAAHRKAFGKTLIDQPLMAGVLADLAIESEAATVVAMRLAEATDRAAAGDEYEAAFRRLALAATKYHVTKQVPAHAAEALECFGGNGYVEESGMPRLYREAPLQSIWEGSGNVAALDALRALARQPETGEAFFAELEKAAGADRGLDDAIARLRKEAAGADEASARRLAESLAVTLQGALLARHGDPAVAGAFIATRLSGDRGRAYGTLPAGIAVDSILPRVAARL